LDLPLDMEPIAAFDRESELTSPSPAPSAELLLPNPAPDPDPADAPAFIDLFAGAGGLSYGLAMAGLFPAAALEIHPHAALTYQRNHRTPILVKDARATTANELASLARDTSPKIRRSGVIDCLVGGPPCQGFSFAGSKNRADSRNTLPLEFVRLVRQLRPSVFVFENVYGLVKLYKGAAFREILTELRSIPGYTVSYEVVSAQAYGVPSMRKRVLVVGTVRSSPFQFPEPTHVATELEALESGPRRFPCVTAGEALSDLDSLVNPGETTMEYTLPAVGAYQRWARRRSTELHNHQATSHSQRVIETFALIPPGRGPECLPPNLRSKKDGLQRIHPDRLCRAILSAPEDLIHYSRDRIPTVREQARLQSFPDNFVFMGQRTSGNQNRKAGYCSQTQQVGNSVPPLLAHAVGRSLRIHLEE
jgi:DNA (cytosine-5)-methyltransferase 1